MPRPVRNAEERYTAAQRAAAEAVLEDPERYGGEGSALVRWARLATRDAGPATEDPPFELTSPQSDQEKTV
jgi:hypothetical protein